MEKAQAGNLGRFAQRPRSHSVPTIGMSLPRRAMSSECKQSGYSQRRGAHLDSTLVAVSRLEDGRMQYGSSSMHPICGCEWSGLH